MTNLSPFKKRQERVRRKLKRVNRGKPRFTVFKSNQHIYAQIIDDNRSSTLVFVSTLDKKLGDNVSCNIEGAKKIGKEVADRAKQAKISEVVFDRSGYIYHGVVKALAESARENGLKF